MFSMRFVFCLALLLCTQAFAGVSVVSPSREVAPQAPPTQPSAEPTNEDPDIQELLATKKRAADQAAALNQMNPQGVVDKVVSGDLTPTMPTFDFSRLPPQLQPFAGFLQSPRVMGGMQRLVMTASQPEFQAASHAIIANQNKKWLYGGMIFVLIVYALLKKRILAATDKLFMRLWIRLGLFALLLVSQFAVAYAVLGSPLLVLLDGWRKIVFG